LDWMSDELRARIAEVDRKILGLVAERMRLAKAIGALKRRRGAGVVDPEVEAAVVSRAVSLGDALGLERSFTNRLVALLVEEAVRLQDPSAKGRYLREASILLGTSGEGGTEELIRLDRDEGDLPLPEPVEKAFREAVLESALTQPSSENLDAVREAVLGWLNQLYGLDLDGKQILITPTGKLAAFVAILALVPQGGRAIIPSPNSPLYGFTVRLVGGREYTLPTSIEDGWEVDLANLGRLLHVHPEIVVLSIPNNPTGKVYSEKTLREMMAMVKETGAFLMVDETCSTTAEGSSSFLQVADSNYVCVGAFPAGFGSDAFRVGYAVSDEDTVKRMERIARLSGSSFPWFAQRAVVKALSLGKSSWQDYEREACMRVALASEELNRMPVRFFRPDRAIHLFPQVEVEAFDSEEFAWRLLKEEHVAVTPGRAFGDYPEFIRISVGTGSKQLKEGIRRVRRALERWARG